MGERNIDWENVMHTFDYKKYKEHTWDGTLKRIGSGRKTHYVNADAYK